MAYPLVLSRIAAVSQADNAREGGDAATVGTELPAADAHNASRPLSSGRDAAVIYPAPRNYLAAMIERSKA